MTKIPRLQHPPSFITKDHFKFLIMDAPTDHNIEKYIKLLQEYQVKVLVRTCEPTYTNDSLEKSDIKVIDIRFSDDEFPSNDVIEEWLKLVHDENINFNRPIGIHCVAGLGRSPLLVAIALIEFAKLTAIESVELIRSIRRGAINERQLFYLKNYKPRYQNHCCIIL